MTPRRRHAPVATVALLAITLCAACFSRDFGAEDDDGIESGFPTESEWNFERMVTLEFSVAESARLESRATPVEVRHTVDGGALIHQGLLSEANNWERTFQVRVPRHETAVTVTIETPQGVVRHIVPIARQGEARTVFR